MLPTPVENLRINGTAIVLGIAIVVSDQCSFHFQNTGVLNAFLEREIAWIVQDLRHAPHADAQFLSDCFLAQMLRVHFSYKLKCKIRRNFVNEIFDTSLSPMCICHRHLCLPLFSEPAQQGLGPKWLVGASCSRDPKSNNQFPILSLHRERSVRTPGIAASL